MRELIFLEPVVKKLIWGKEYWTVSAHESGDCLVRGGTYDGLHLSQLWSDHKEIFGVETDGDFPFIVKVIDARDPLSIQVHPDNEYASKTENGASGKTECWYVMDCDRDASIIIGHKAESRQEAARMIEEGRWDDLLREIPVKKGDFFQITPGTVHAIKQNTMIMEIQQSSDVTYRLYDYGRVRNGEPRALHVDKSLDVMRIPHTDAGCYTNGVKGRLVSCRYYDVDRYDIAGSRDFEKSDKFMIISVLEGEGGIDGRKIKAGESFIVSGGYGDFTIFGSLSVMVTRLPKLYGGLEAGGTKMVCALGYADGTIEDKISFPTTTPEKSIPRIIEYFKDKEICSLGIGSFGPVDVNPDSESYGNILDSPKLAWQHYPLKKVLEDALCVPIKVDTDVNGSCLGEMTFGCAEGMDNVGYVTIGTGIGAGMAVNGQLVHGMGHPEFGHILVSRIEGDDYKGKCPFHPTCFESLASGPAIEERWGKKAEELSDRPEVWEMEADYIAQGLMAMVLTISPRKIILGGGVMHQQQLFPLIRKKLKEKLAGYIHTRELDDIDDYVVPASLDDEQGIKGAVQLGVLAEIESK